MIDVPLVGMYSLFICPSLCNVLLFITSIIPRHKGMTRDGQTMLDKSNPESFNKVIGSDIMDL